jgi:hypothetical protein
MPVSGSLLLLYAGAHKISTIFVTKKLGIEGEFSNAQMIIYLRRH